PGGRRWWGGAEAGARVVGWVGTRPRFGGGGGLGGPRRTPSRGGWRAPPRAQPVRQPRPARPLTVSCARPTTEKKKEKQKRVARCARSVSTTVDTYPTAAIARRSTPCVDDSFDI
ncbi:hypothetical protein DI494_22205, partial [Stenotrophomonas maltophilia]